MHSLAPAYLDRLSFSAGEAAALAALTEIRGRQALFTNAKPEVLESLRQVAVVESTESSNRIEGISAPRTRIEAIVRHRTEYRDRPEQEIAGYRDALALIHENHEHMPLTVSTLLQLHKAIYRYHSVPGGRLKKADNRIDHLDREGRLVRVRFRPTSAFETPAAMDALIAGYRDATGARALHPLVAVPLAILALLCIHPFTDGNGRVARLATLLLLYHHGFALGRYISLERIVEESKAGYYETLEASSKRWHEGKHDVHPWLGYFWGTLTRTGREFEERVGAVANAAGAKSGLVRAAVLRRTAPFTSTDIERECPGVSHELVRRVMRALRDEGIIVRRGHGRGSRWLRR